MKKILALTLAMIMLLVCFAACSKGETEEEETVDAFKDDVVLMYENFYYSTNDDGSYEITGIRLVNNEHVDLEIPAEINGREVTGIANDAFKSINTIESVEIPEGILYIGEYAFFGCDALESVELPATLEVIGKGAFEGCISLVDIEIEDDSALTTIGNYAFKGCSTIGSFSFSGAIETVGDGAFMDCDMLTSVSLQSNVKKLGAAAFSGCDQLSVFYVANDTLEIGEAAFFTGAELVMVTANSGSTAEAYVNNNPNYMVFIPAEVVE